MGLALLLFEVLSSLVLLYRYRSKYPELTDFHGEISYSSSVNLIFKAGKEAGLFKKKTSNTVEYRRETQPDPFLISDSILGYKSSPGEYKHTYFRKETSQHDWQSLAIKVTINEDGSRWTGNTEQTDCPTVYIFGDSFVFGTGVNDEHTFAYLLQQSRPDLKVKLFALPGYSLTQSYLIFNTLRPSIEPGDFIVLGYADFYNERHVVAPSRLRNIRKWRLLRNQDLANKDFYLPKANLVGEDNIDFEYIQENCLYNPAHCDKSDPNSLEMTQVTAAIINTIANNTVAKVHLLHFKGDQDDPLFKLIKNDVTRVSALAGDFDHYIQDDIEGFDTHPGPYWHYAISRKLLEVFAD